MSKMYIYTYNPYKHTYIDIMSYQNKNEYTIEPVEEIISITYLLDRIQSDWYPSEKYTICDYINDDNSSDNIKLILDELYKKKYIHKLYIQSNKPISNLFKMLDNNYLLQELMLETRINNLQFVEKLLENLDNNDRLLKLKIKFGYFELPMRQEHYIPDKPSSENLIEINDKLYNIVINLIENSYLQKIDMIFDQKRDWINNTYEIIDNLFNKHQLENIDNLLKIPLEKRKICLDTKTKSANKR